MNIVQKIYLAPVVSSSYDADIGRVEIEILVDRFYYSGVACLHPDDREYFSLKVGRNIALSRARMSAIYTAWESTKETAQQVWIHYCRVSKCGTINTEETKNLHRKALSAMKKAEDIRTCLEDEKRVLKDYLKGQERAMQSLKRFRSNPNQDNNS